MTDSVDTTTNPPISHPEETASPGPSTPAAPTTAPAAPPKVPTPPPAPTAPPAPVEPAGQKPTPQTSTPATAPRPQTPAAPQSPPAAPPQTPAQSAPSAATPTNTQTATIAPPQQPTTPSAPPSGTAAPAAPTAEKGNVPEETKSLPLGEKLVEYGLISRDQLETVLKEQRQVSGPKKMLGTLLIEMGFITESTLSEVLTESSGVKILDIKKTVLDSNIIKKVPKEVAMRYKVVPVSIENDTVLVAITDIYNILALDQIRLYFPSNYKITPVYAPESDILEVIDQYYGYETSIGGILKEIETGIVQQNELSGEIEGYVNPTVRLVDAILVDAIKKRASDIHFEPEESFLRIRYRIDGKLIQIRSFHKDYWSAIAVRIKIMSDMNIAETRFPQDGRISYYVLGREVDFRVATHPTVFGENVVMRILDKQKALMPIDDLGLSASNVSLLKKLLKRPEGIIIVTGPTGSGKTTTLYSVLNYINSPDINIMTLENPVEYQLPMLRQSDIKEEKGMDFVSGIKSLMRQDPDVIFVGEIRDEATANMAMRAAMTGHRVFSTLHTNDAFGAIPRLIDIGIPPHLLAGSLICIMAQRLVRRLCKHCKEPYSATEEEKRIFGVDQNKELTLYRAKGCEHCNDSGYSGRVAVHEIFPVDKGLDEMISTGASRKAMIAYVSEKGFTPIIQDGIAKAVEGLTSLQELIRTIDMTERL